MDKILIIFPILVIVGYLFARSRRHCNVCGSWRSRVEEEIKREWGTDFGGILKMDPLYYRIKLRQCENGHIISRKEEFIGNDVPRELQNRVAKPMPSRSW